MSVYPKTGLSAGTYTLTVTLTADNLATAVTSTVTFTVEPVIFTYRPSAEDTTGEFTETITEPGAHTPPECSFEVPAGMYFSKWGSAPIVVYPFTPSGIDRVFIPVFSGYNAFLTFHENGGALTGSSNVIETSKYHDLYEPSHYGILSLGGEFLYWAVGSPDSEIRLNSSERYHLTSNDDVDIYAVWSGPKAATPTEVSFVATGYDTGKLTGVSAGLRYRQNMGGANIISGNDDVSLISLIPGDVITVWRVGNDTTTVDSDPVTFTLTKAATPTGVGMVKPTTLSNNDGKITGVDSTMEYKRAGDAAWTAITGTEVTGLANGNYYVRVKGSGTVLASNDVNVTVAEYVEVALPKAATPMAEFGATGESEGFIWQVEKGVTYEWYTSLDSTKHTVTPYDADEGYLTDNRFDITGLTGACTIYVVRKGNGTTTSDSDPKEITVGKATQLTKEDIFDNVSTWPYDVSSSGEVFFPFSCEKWNRETSAWVGKSTTFSFKMGDSLTFRKCANGNELASDSVTVTMYPQTAKAGEVSLSLTQGFKFNYYVTMTPAEVAAANVVITFRGNAYSATPTTTGFVFEEVTPQYLGETVNAKLYIGDVVAYEVSCSVKSYLEAVTAADPTNAELQTLANDILVYGGAAQNYVCYKTGELVSDGVTGTTFVPLLSRTPTLTDNGDRVTFRSATVRFDNSVHLKIKLTKHEESALFALYCNDSKVELVSDGAGGYFVTTPAIYASDIKSDATFQARIGGINGATLVYGIGHYVYAMQDREDAMGDLARALWNYGLAAEAYAASLES